MSAYSQKSFCGNQELLPTLISLLAFHIKHGDRAPGACLAEDANFFFVTRNSRKLYYKAPQINTYSTFQTCCFLSCFFVTWSESCLLACFTDIWNRPWHFFLSLMFDLTLRGSSSGLLAKWPWSGGTESQMSVCGCFCVIEWGALRSTKRGEVRGDDLKCRLRESQEEGKHRRGTWYTI